MLKKYIISKLCLFFLLWKVAASLDISSNIFIENEPITAI